MIAARRNHLNDYLDNVNFAVNLQTELENNSLNIPPHCTLRPRIDDFVNSVCIDFVNPRSNRTGYVMMSQFQMNNGDNYINVFCSVDNYNGYFMEVLVNSVEGILGVAAFCQHILQYQPEQEEIDFVRVPPHLLNHWCVQPNLRLRNLNEYNPDPVVGDN